MLCYASAATVGHCVRLRTKRGRDGRRVGGKRGGGVEEKKNGGSEGQKVGIESDTNYCDRTRTHSRFNALIVCTPGMRPPERSRAAVDRNLAIRFVVGERVRGVLCGEKKRRCSCLNDGLRVTTVSAGLSRFNARTSHTFLTTRAPRRVAARRGGRASSSTS